MITHWKTAQPGRNVEAAVGDPGAQSANVKGKQRAPAPAAGTHDGQITKTASSTGQVSSPSTLTPAMDGLSTRPMHQSFQRPYSHRPPPIQTSSAPPSYASSPLSATSASVPPLLPRPPASAGNAPSRATPSASGPPTSKSASVDSYAHAPTASPTILHNSHLIMELFKKQREDLLKLVSQERELRQTAEQDLVMARQKLDSLIKDHEALKIRAAKERSVQWADSIERAAVNVPPQTCAVAGE